MLNDNAVLTNADVASLEVVGNNVTVSNVRVDGNVLVSGSHVTLDHVTAKGIAVSSASDVTIRYANIGFSGDDALHITSDSGSFVRDIRVEHNYIHDPRAPSSAHYDGTQIRGAANVSITCNTYDAGPYQDTFNAAIYLENANGGVSGVTVANNWLLGFAWTFMVSATGTVLTGNVIGGDIHWGTCYLAASSGPVSVSGNVEAGSGQPLSPCQGG